jgi:nucleotide-binding universal stress UspA family protein
VFAYDAPPEWKGTPYHQRSLEAHEWRGRDVLERLPARADGIDAETALVEGPPAQALAQVAQDNEADEIVVASRGSGPRARSSAAHRTRCSTGRTGPS